jgi:hypothetical protein
MSSDPENGTLGAVPGRYISEGSAGLPPAADHRGRELSAVVDTGTLWQGPVRIRYCSTAMRHGRSQHWSWVAVHAEPVSED